MTTVKPGAIVAIVALLLPGALAAREIREKPKVQLDAARLASVRKIAVISVYGPTTLVEGLARSTKVDLNPFYDQAEQAIVAGLRQNGYEIVPMEATRAAVERSFVDLYVDAWKAETGNEKEKRRIESERETLRARRFTKFSITPVASRNTSYVYPAAYEFPRGLAFHVEDGAPVIVKNNEVIKGGVPTANQPTALRTALGGIAKILGADAALIVRVVPDMVGAYSPPATKSKGILSLGQQIRDTRNAVKFMKTGDYGASILDVGLYDRTGATIFESSIVGRSKEDVGSAFSGAVAGRGQDASTVVMKEAIDASLMTTFGHLGKPLAANTPGLGLGGMQQAVAESAAAAALTRDQVAAKLAGTWIFESANGSPLPFSWTNGTVVTGGEYTFRPDGTFSSSFDMLYQQKGEPVEKNQKMEGTYTIFPDGSIVLKGKGIFAKLWSTFLAPMTMTAPDTLSAAQGNVLLVYRRKA